MHPGASIVLAKLKRARLKTIANHSSTKMNKVSSILGHKRDHIKPLPQKVQAILDIDAPKNKEGSKSPL